MTGSPRAWTRRALLGTAAGALLGACLPARETARPQGPAAGPEPRIPASPSPSTSPSPTPSPDPPYEPDPGDVELDAKRLAGRLAVALTTYTPNEPALAVAGRALAPAPTLVGPDGLAGLLGGLLVPGAASRGRVVYPQLGGETPARDACSVMVVTEQQLSGAGGDQAVTRTLDVRLRRGPDGAWAFEALASNGGDPVARPADLPPAAAAVLDDPRIALPDSARWDIHAGRIAEPLLTTLSALAAVLPLGVTCLASGHPAQVFATPRTSNHTVGRAVDLWRVDTGPVALQRADLAGPAGRLLAAALALPTVGELGGPWDLDGPAKRSFTDRVVHHDHLHVGLA